MFSLAYNLPKTRSNFCPSKLRQIMSGETTWIFRPEKLHRKKYVETTWIFRPSNYIIKSMWKQRVFFDHQNYIKKSTWKQRRFFDQPNYVEKSMWKRRGFFDRRSYIEKVRGNNVKFVEIWSWTYRCNIDVESTLIRRGVLVWSNFNPFATSALFLCPLKTSENWKVL